MSDGRKMLLVDAHDANESITYLADYDESVRPDARRKRCIRGLTPQSEGGEAIEIHEIDGHPVTVDMVQYKRLLTERDDLCRWNSKLRAERDALRVHVKTVGGCLDRVVKERDAARAESKRIRDALLNLVVRLHEIEHHSSYKSIMAVGRIHGMAYSGPTWEEPARIARAALEESEE